MGVRRQYFSCSWSQIKAPFNKTPIPPHLHPYPLKSECLITQHTHFFASLSSKDLCGYFFSFTVLWKALVFPDSPQEWGAGSREGGGDSPSPQHCFKATRSSENSNKTIWMIFFLSLFLRLWPNLSVLSQKLCFSVLTQLFIKIACWWMVAFVWGYSEENQQHLGPIFNTGFLIFGYR